MSYWFLGLIVSCSQKHKHLTETWFPLRKNVLQLQISRIVILPVVKVDGKENDIMNQELMMSAFLPAGSAPLILKSHYLILRWSPLCISEQVFDRWQASWRRCQQTPSKTCLCILYHECNNLTRKYLQKIDFGKYVILLVMFI